MSLFPKKVVYAFKQEV